jgi:hypothetical protein
LGVADEVEYSLFVVIVGKVDPASGSDSGGFEVLGPGFVGAVGFVDQACYVAGCGAAVTSDGVEVNVVVLVSAIGECVVDLESADLGVNLICLRRIHFHLSEGLSDLVGLVCVALPEAEVGFVGGFADASGSGL